MATTWKAPTWRMPNEKNQSKFESYSVNFNGTDEYIDSNDTFSALDGLKTISLSVWIKPTDLSNFRHIFSIPQGTGNNNNIVRLTIRNTGVLWWTLGTDSYRGTELSQSLILNEWNHVVCIFDTTQALSSNRVKVFVNNTQSSLDLNMPQNRVSGTATGGVFIGENGSNLAYLSSFKGEISQVSIFNYAVSNAQVSSLYNSGSPINPMTLKPAPIAYYPLGGNASTAGNIGSDTLSVPNVAVPDASVFDFNGNTNINIPDSDSLSFGDSVNDSPFSMSAWIKTSSSASKGIISKWGTTGTSGYEWIFWTVGAPAKLRMNLNDGTNAVYRYRQGNTNVDTGEWVHAVVTYDGRGGNDANDGIKIYVNGQEESSYTNGSAGTYQAMHNTDRQVQIGAYNSVGQFNGEISNAEIWDVVLQPSEILELYNNGQPLLTGTQPQEANLQAWWKLNQSANWEADTANNWQIPDAVSAYPQSFDFNGTNSYITYNRNPSISTSNVTISGWFKTDSTNLQGIVGGGGNDGMVIWLINGAKLAYYHWTSGGWGPNMVYPVLLNLNEWYHFAATWDESTTTRVLYLNGQPVLTNTTTTDLVWNNNYGWLGRYSSSEFDGQLSNIQIHNSTLPATGANSIQTLYNNGVPLETAIDTSNLYAWWKLDNTELFDGTNWSVENQKYLANYESAIEATELTGLELDSATPNLGTTQSFSWWVNYKKSSLGSYLFNKGSMGWRIYVYNNGTLLFRPTSSNTYMVNTGTGVIQAHQSIGNGKWYHYVLTRDGENVVIYQNSEVVYTGTIPGTDPAPATDDIDFIASEYGTFDVDTKFSNFCIFNNKLEQSDVTSLYNNGTPFLNMDSFTSLQNWWKLNNLTTGLQASAGNINVSVRSGTPGFNEVNTFVSTQAGLSSGMTEQNLVNNNVSALNGESSGMNTSNLVTSTLTRQVPYNSYSLYFDGSSDYVEVPDDASLKPTSTITCSMWFNCGTQNTNRQFLSKYYDTVDGAYGFYTNGSSSDLYFYVTVSGTTYDSPVGSGFFDDNWHHAVGVYDGANIYLYVDGAQQGTSTAQTGSISYNNGILCFASLAGSPTTYEVDTYLNNISIFNEALTSTEILKLYNSGVPSDLSSFSPQPVSWWSLGSDSYFNGTNYICPDLIGTNNSNASSGLNANSLVGYAPNSTANGTSTNMTYGANISGSAPNSSNNSFSVNMSYDDRVSGSGDVPG